MLRQMLYEYGPWSPQKRFAKVLGSSPMRPNELLYIDQGSDHGVQVDDIVLAGERTLVGRVSEVYREVSLVETIFSRRLKIASRIFRTLTDGLLMPSNEGLELTLLPAEADVEAGDTVITSGRDGTFFAGFLIGKIIASHVDDHSRLQTAKVETPINIGKLEMVVVVRRPF